MLTVAYIAFAVVGCGYVLIAALLGHFFEGSDAGDPGSHDAGAVHGAGGTDAYGVDAGGHGSVSAADVTAAEFHFPFFSPLALATLVGAIGAWGLIARFGFKSGDTASLLVALPLAFGTAYLVTYVGWRLVQGSRGSSTLRLGQLVGAPAEVLTPIPPGGVGEVAVVVGGQRHAGPAREAEGREVARGTLVTVVRVIGGTLVVSVARGPAAAGG